MLLLLNSCQALKYKPVDAREVSPDPKERVRKNIEEGKAGRLMGGFGSAILEALQENNCSHPVERFGWPDEFVEHGSSVAKLRIDVGLTSEMLLSKIRARKAAGHPQ